jgi:hypothetical protein
MNKNPNALELVNTVGELIGELNREFIGELIDEFIIG